MKKERKWETDADNVKSLIENLIILLLRKPIHNSSNKEQLHKSRCKLKLQKVFGHTLLCPNRKAVLASNVDVKAGNKFSAMQSSLQSLISRIYTREPWLQECGLKRKFHKQIETSVIVFGPI